MSEPMSDQIVKAPETKSWVQQFVDKARGDIAKAPPASAVSYVKETGSTLAEYAVGGTVGSLLGATHAKWGLDTKGGPIDGWIAGAGALVSIGLSGHFPQFAAYARKIGDKAFTVLSFRKGFEVVKHEPLAGGSFGAVQRIAPAGKSAAMHGEDPIEKAAADLG